MKNLTKKQQKVLDYISKRLSLGGCPSQRRIAEHLGISQNAVFQFITCLKSKGYLQSEKGHRGLKLSGSYLQQQSFSDRIPVLGCAMTSRDVSDGKTVENNKNRPVKRFINLNSAFGKIGKMFFVRVSGNALNSVGVIDNDYVLISPDEKFSDGQIGLVLLDDKIWLKQLYVNNGAVSVFDFVSRSGRGIRQRIDLKNESIVGIVTGLIRLPVVDG